MMMLEKKILSPEELETLNSTMIGRGAPVEEDGIGYNKPDWCKFSDWYAGLSNAQLAELATGFIKYAKSQLNLNTEDLTATASYYRLLAKSNKNEGVSVEIVGSEVRIAFEFNIKFINKIKLISGRRYDMISQDWFVPTSQAFIVLDYLADRGADVENARTYLKNNLTVELVKTVPAAVKKTVVKGTLDNHTVAISFDYNEKIISIVKSIEGRTWNSGFKFWSIPVEGITALVSKLSTLPNLDMTTLEEIAKTHITSLKNQMMSVPLMDITILNRKPFNHQVESANFLLTQKKAILAHEMGTGKTMTSILANNSLVGKKLIIVPASLKLNWKKEIEMVDPKGIVEIVNGSGWDLKKINVATWVIINYDILDKNIDSIMETDFISVTMDECHFIKSVNNYGLPTAKRGKSALKIAEKTEYVFMLTGTPVMNHVKDLFNLLVAINAPMARDWKKFAFAYCGAENNGYGYSFDGATNTEELYNRLKNHMSRVLKSEVLDLPEKIRQFIAVDVNLRDYNRMVKEYMDARKKGNVKNQGEHLVYLNALRHEMAKAKVDMTIEQVENILENGHQVVVFSCYDYVIDKVIAHFGDNVCVIRGGMSDIDKDQSVTDFQSGKKQVIVANIRSGGVGLTLTAGRAVVFNDFDWTAMNHLQAEDRIHRQSQKNECNIYYMFCANALIDDKFAGMLDLKLRDSSKVLDGLEKSFIDEMMVEFSKISS